MVDAPYERIPVYVREGAIIPFGPEMEWSDEKPAELINLYVYAGQNGQFQLYEDEGTNYNYEKGKWATIDITYDDATRTVSFAQRQGQFPRHAEGAPLQRGARHEGWAEGAQPEESRG